MNEQLTKPLNHAHSRELSPEIFQGLKEWLRKTLNILLASGVFFMAPGVKNILSPLEIWKIACQKRPQLADLLSVPSAYAADECAIVFDGDTLTTGWGTYEVLERDFSVGSLLDCPDCNQYERFVIGGRCITGYEDIVVQIKVAQLDGVPTNWWFTYHVVVKSDDGKILANKMTGNSGAASNGILVNLTAAELGQTGVVSVEVRRGIDDALMATGAIDVDGFPPVKPNNVPVAVDDEVATDEDHSITGNILLNDTDLDGDSLFVLEFNGQPVPTDGDIQVTGSGGGEVTINSKGDFHFNPTCCQDLNDGDTRTTSFSYKISDGRGGEASAILTFTVTGSNDGPIVSLESKLVEGDPYTCELEAKVVSDVDGPLNDEYAYSWKCDEKDLVEAESFQSINYTFPVGEHLVKVTVCDGDQFSTAEVTITVKSLLGDANCDGKVDQADLALIQKALLELLPPDAKICPANALNGEYFTEQDMIFVIQELAKYTYLYKGWNLKGLKSDQSKNIEDLVSGNEDKIESVWKWKDGVWAVYLPGEADGGAEYAKIKGFEPLTNIESTEGFWVNASVDIEKFKTM
ncbi:MAG: cadherin-like domain-containing protein [Candidatus Peribacteraceae bacterium]|nr:cadherin-like domain-containing protein [Candidatus Gracilibacteria bacterium]MCF7846355.1 cadherin-like domain-containing protein [Candidatus Peribacteraceae bacterium]